MRIVQVIQRPQLRGAELFACQLSNHLIQSGNEVVVISIFSGDAQLPFAGKILNLERPLAYRFFDWKGWRLLANVVKQMNPDIIQANAGDTLKFVVFSKLLFAWKKPIVFRNASTVSSYIRSTPVLLINRFLYKQVSLVVSVSEFSKTDLVRLFPFLENKTVRIPIGIELERGEQLPPAENTPYLVHVGGFTFEKNHAGLLRIFKEISKINTELELWLIGDGPLLSQIRELAQDLQLSEKIKFLGKKNYVGPYMKAAKAVLLPSIIEGLPAVILEAFYHKVFVIAFDVGGIAEVLNNETGWLVPAGDEFAFVSAVTEALSSTDDKRIKQKAFEQVMSSYTNEVIAKQFEMIYRKLAMENELTDNEQTKDSPHH